MHQLQSLSDMIIPFGQLQQFYQQFWLPSETLEPDSRELSTDCGSLEIYLLANLFRDTVVAKT